MFEGADQMLSQQLSPISPTVLDGERLLRTCDRKEDTLQEK